MAASAAAKASPDGYTLYYADAAFLTAPSILDKLPYDPVRSFAPVSGPCRAACDRRQSSGTCENAAGADLTGQGESGKVQLRHPGVGTLQHLCGELLRTWSESSGPTFRTKEPRQLCQT